jgi:hypothetical protein
MEATGMNGALLLGVISVVCLGDIIIARWFMSLADNIDTDVGSAPQAGAKDPAAMGRAARVLFISAPVMWVVVALLSFGIIPVDGIVPIKF